MGGLLWDVFCIAGPTAAGNAFEYLPVVFGLAIVGRLENGREALWNCVQTKKIAYRTR